MVRVWLDWVAVKVALKRLHAVMATLVLLIRVWVVVPPMVTRNEQPLVAELARYMVRLYFWPITRFLMDWLMVE